MRLQLSTLYVASCLAMVAPLHLGAQRPSGHGADASIGIRAGTLGFGLEASKLLTNHLGIRVGGNTFKISKTQTSSDVTFDAELKMQSFSALLDLYPSPRGSFHFTGGLVTNPVKISATGVPSTSGTFTLNGNDYTAAQVGTLTGSGKYSSVVPYAGLGLGTPASSKGSLKLVFDLGVLIGKPTVALDATGAASGSQLAADIQTQVTQTQHDVNTWLPVWPVLSLGLVFRF